MIKKPAGAGEQQGHRAASVVSLLLALALWSACLATFAQPARPPQPIGNVEQLRGAGFAQSDGQLPRVLGRGLPLLEGDRLTTADNALAVIKLNDGTKMTLRPGTELVLSQFSYSANNANPSLNAMVLQLLRGGLRAITGLINKTSPNAARIQTSTATIGIRGTDFDARICKAGECSAIATVAPTPSNISASARVLKQQGQLTALDEQGQRRALSPGAGIYPGDTVETASNATALLAFRDDSKISLGASTRFRVDDFAFNAADLSGSRYFMSLLRGSLRAITGVIGRSNQRNVRFTTNTATVGIRGTEFAMDCTGACAQAPPDTTAAATTGLTVFTFNGVLVVAITQPSPAGQPLAPIELLAGRGLLVSGQADGSGLPAVEFLTIPPSQLLTESLAGVVVPVEFFSQALLPDDTEGLFVFVRDGHIALVTDRQQIDLGRGEAGVVGAALEVVRLQNIPSHVVGDTTPLPTAANINLSGVRLLRSTDPICRP